MQIKVRSDNRSGMSSEGNVSLIRMAVNHWIGTENLFHKKEDSLASPEASDTRMTSMHRNCCAESCVLISRQRLENTRKPS